MRFRVFTEIMFDQGRLGYLRLAREAKYLLLAPRTSTQHAEMTLTVRCSTSVETHRAAA